MKNKTVIITGASSGIGKEIAKYFITRGSNVVMNSSNEENLRKAYNWILRTKLRQAFRFHCASDFGSNCATSLRDFGSFCATLKDRAITLSPKNRRYGKYT